MQSRMYYVLCTRSFAPVFGRTVVIDRVCSANPQISATSVSSKLHLPDDALISI